MQWDIGFSVTLYKLKYLQCVVEATEKIYWFLSNVPDTIVTGFGNVDASTLTDATDSGGDDSFFETLFYIRSLWRKIEQNVERRRSCVRRLYA